MLASLNLVDTLAYWTFTDVFEEEGCGMTPFRTYLSLNLLLLSSLR